MKKAFALFLVLFAFVYSAHAADKKHSVIILDFVEVKDGQGCTQATAKTKFPLTSKQCEQFLKENGLLPIVDARNPLMQIIREAVIPKGTVFAYIVTKDFSGWVFVDRD